MSSFDTFEEELDVDTKIQSTANDALSSKYSACSVGYFVDPFLKVLVEQMFPSLAMRSNRKPPIINRGYYGRIRCFEQIINSFLETTSSFEGERQIVSLGCGFDTNSVNIISQNHQRLQLFEVDFRAVINRKADLLLRVPLICEALGLNTSIESSDITSDSLPSIGRPIRRKESFKTTFGYKIGALNLLSVDIRIPGALCSALVESGANPLAPTLFVTECVLVYIDQSKVLALSHSVSSQFQNAVWASYDMINPHDPFGKTMLRNLMAARHKVPGFVEFPTTEAHRNRYLQTGWEEAKSITMLSAFNAVVPVEDKQRIARLEMLDEIEEWELIMQHYAFTVAVHGHILPSLLAVIP